jgi:trans-L-3-hydroxyproline dehydratase
MIHHIVKEKLKNAENWAPPDRCTRIRTIDSHTGGEPFRVITSGFPDLGGDTILARRRYAADHFDHLRKALMWEPRGHADMYGCIVTPPVSENADLGVLFIHNEGYSSMCGHGIIALSTVVLETGILPGTESETSLRIDTPAGLITSYSEFKDDRVGSVRFTNVASFVSELDAVVSTDEFGEVRYDLAFGGAFYAYVNAEELGLSCEPEDVQQLIDAGKSIKRAVIASREISHPFEQDLGFLYGVIFVFGDDPLNSRNVCVFADGEVDRSPTGTGVSGRLAIHHARGQIEVGEKIIVESIVGSSFEGFVESKTEFGGLPAIIPSIKGTAFITGRHEFLIDPEDEIGKGFILR